MPRDLAHLAHSPCPMDPYGIDARIRDVDPLLFLAWNPRVQRHEIWRHPHRATGAPEFILRVQRPDGGFRLPGADLVAHLRSIDAWRTRDLMDGLAAIEAQEAAREAQQERRDADLAEQGARLVHREAVDMHRSFAMNLRREAG